MISHQLPFTNGSIKNANSIQSKRPPLSLDILREREVICVYQPFVMHSFTTKYKLMISSQLQVLVSNKEWSIKYHQDGRLSTISTFSSKQKFDAHQSSIIYTFHYEIYTHDFKPFSSYKW